MRNWRGERIGGMGKGVKAAEMRHAEADRRHGEAVKAAEMRHAEAMKRHEEDDGASRGIGEGIEAAA